MEWRAPVTEGVWEMAFVVMANFFLIFMGPSKEEGEKELQIRGLEGRVGGYEGCCCTNGHDHFSLLG